MLRLLSTLMFVVLLAVGPIPAFAQEKTDTKPSADSLSKCSCEQKPRTVRSAKKHSRRSTGKHGKKKPSAKKPAQPTGPIIRYLPAPAQPIEKKIVATAANFGPMTVPPMSEKFETGEIQLSDNTKLAGGYERYLNAHGSDGITAWIKGNMLHVYSKGGQGKVVISNKDGDTLEVVNITDDTPVAVSATDSNIAGLLSTANGIWWIALAILVVLLLHAIISFFQRRRSNNRLEGIDEELRGIRSIVHNIDVNFVSAAESQPEYGGIPLRRRAGVKYYEKPQTPEGDANQDLNDPDREPTGM